MSRFRLAVYSHSLGSGGAERAAGRIASEFQRRGYEVAILCEEPDWSHAGELDPAPARLDAAAAMTRSRAAWWAHRLRAMAGLAAHGAPVSRVFRWSHRWCPSDGAISLLRSFRPDGLISFGAETNLRAVHLPRALRDRLVLSSQNDPTQAVRELHGRAGATGVRITRRLYPRSAGVVAVSTFIRDVLRRLGVPRVTVAPNPIDLDAIAGRSREPVATAAGPPIIVHVGRHTAVKNIPLLLEAFALVRARTPCRLWLCGDGEDRPAFEADVRRRGLADSVTFHGFVSNPYAFVAAAKCLVLTSRREGSPVALLEALACGTPAVTSRYPGVEDVGGEEAGVLVAGSDAPSIASAIERVLRDDALALRLSEAGRRRSRDFSAARIADVYERILRA